MALLLPISVVPPYVHSPSIWPASFAPCLPAGMVDPSEKDDMLAPLDKRMRHLEITGALTRSDWLMLYALCTCLLFAC